MNHWSIVDFWNENTWESGLPMGVRVWTASDYWNFEDMNRIETTINSIADMVETFMSRPTIVSPKLDRDMKYLEYKNALNRIEQNILNLKIVQPHLAWVDPKVNWLDLDTFSYTDVNRLETDLYALYYLAYGIIQSFKYCGQAVCGGVLWL